MRKIQEVIRASEVRLGSRVTMFQQEEDRVRVRVQDEQGSEEELEAEYLVGADGAHSLVRKTLNLPFPGDTLPNQLVATDILYDFNAHGFYDANFVIDEEDYGLIGRINKEGLWRVSYGVSNQVEEEEVRRGCEEKVRRMLPGGGEGGFEIRRVAPYRAQQRCVERMWEARVGLVGDAAHCKTSYTFPIPISICL